MTENESEPAADQPMVISAEAVIRAPVDVVFALIADPAQQPRWDGNDNLAEAAPGQRVHAVGDVFTTTLKNGQVRENHVVEFAEGRTIAWRPAPVGEPNPGHLWRWEVEPDDEVSAETAGARTLVRQVYDWTELTGWRIERARATTPEMLMASIVRLKELAEGAADPRRG